jgi:transcriptional regulator with XRE-family HTH domain
MALGCESWTGFFIFAGWRAREMGYVLTLRAARQRLGLTQMDLSTLTGVNQAIVSQIERGLRSPTSSQRQRLHGALGRIEFFEQEDIRMANVPDMPEAKWKDGKPDFAHLCEGNEEVLKKKQNQRTIATQKRYEEGQGVPDPEEADQ